jgi:hypothetical protein
MRTKVIARSLLPAGREIALCTSFATRLVQTHTYTPLKMPPKNKGKKGKKDDDEAFW